MNELIETIFDGFAVDGVEIPVLFLRYNGKADTYITYMHTDSANSLSGDDELTAYVMYFDFDIYSKGNLTNIISSVKKKMKDNGFMFEPSRCSSDMFEEDTKYYHKTLCFAIEKGEE